MGRLHNFCIFISLRRIANARTNINSILMGIGRREFLRLTGLALAGFIIDPFKAVATSDHVYVNKKLGVLFHIPRDWGFIAVTDFGKLKDAQIIGEGIDETAEEIWADLGDPICVATKYHKTWDKPETHGVFSPTITLNITPKTELEYLGHETFEELMADIEYAMPLILKDHRIIKRYEPYFISGVKFYEHDAEYMFEHEDLTEPLKVELKSLHAEHNGFYYDFNCHQSKTQNQLAGKEFEEFRRTIKLI